MYIPELATFIETLSKVPAGAAQAFPETAPEPRQDFFALLLSQLEGLFPGSVPPPAWPGTNDPAAPDQEPVSNLDQSAEVPRGVEPKPEETSPEIRDDTEGLPDSKASPIPQPERPLDQEQDHVPPVELAPAYLAALLTAEPLIAEALELVSQLGLLPDGLAVLLPQAPHSNIDPQTSQPELSEPFQRLLALLRAPAPGISQAPENPADSGGVVPGHSAFPQELSPEISANWVGWLRALMNKAEETRPLPAPPGASAPSEQPGQGPVLATRPEPVPAQGDLPARESDLGHIRPQQPAPVIVSESTSELGTVPEARDGPEPAVRITTETPSPRAASFEQSVAIFESAGDRTMSARPAPKAHIPMKTEPESAPQPLLPLDVNDAAPTRVQRVENAGAAVSMPKGPASLEVIGEVVVRSVRYLVGRGERVMTVRLVPPTLGELQIDVTQTRDSLSVRLVSASPVVREILEGQVADLRQALAREGFDVGRVAVAAHLAAGSETLGSPGRYAEALAFVPPAAVGRTTHETYPEPRQQGAAVSYHDGVLDVFA